MHSLLRRAIDAMDFASPHNASRTVLTLTPRLQGRGGPLAFALACVVVAGFVAGGPALADRVRLDDGRVLTGSFANVAGVKTDPFADREQAESTPILVCDDGL